MQTSENGIELIKRFEGLELESYQDIAGVWTIGYGHTETAGPNQKISASEAEQLLRRDLKPREKAVNDLVSVGLNQNEFDALVSFVYNVGINAFKGSTARKRLNRGDRLGAADALTWWNKATVNGVLREVTGLTRRRASERALFLTPVNPPIVNDEKAIDENSRATPVEDGPRRENLTDSRTVQGAVIAGGAGAAAATIGKDSAEELDQLETNIENGESLTEDKPADALTPDGQPPENPDPPVESPREDAPGDGAAGDAAPQTDGADASGVDAPTADETPAVETPVSDPPVADAPIAETPAGDAPVSDAPASDTPVEGVADAAGSETAAEQPATTEVAAVNHDRPSKHEKHAADAQIQLALLALIVIGVLLTLFARFDDWRNYKR
jgi:lysozyme